MYIGTQPRLMAAASDVDTAVMQSRDVVCEQG